MDLRLEGNVDGEAGPTALLLACEDTDARFMGFFRVWGRTHPEVHTAWAEHKMWPLHSKCPQTVHENPGQKWSRSGSRAGIQPSVARSEGGVHSGSDHKQQTRVPLRTEPKGRADLSGQ